MSSYPSKCSFRLLPLLAASLIAACANAPSKPQSEPPASVADQAVVHDRILVSGQPTRQDLERLSERGITQVFNLRTDAEMAELGFDEAALLSSSAIAYEHQRIAAATDYTPELLAKFKAAVDASEGKVLLHCASGGRAAMLYAAYAMKYQGLEPDAAMRTLATAGAWPLPLERLTGEKLKVVRAESGKPQQP